MSDSQTKLELDRRIQVLCHNCGQWSPIAHLKAQPEHSQLSFECPKCLAAGKEVVILRKLRKLVTVE